MDDITNFALQGALKAEREEFKDLAAGVDRIVQTTVDDAWVRMCALKFALRYSISALEPGSPEDVIVEARKFENYLLGK